MLIEPAAIPTLSNISVGSFRTLLGGNMRASRVVRKTKYCWRSVVMIKTPETTNVAIVRPSLQAQTEPANVKAMVKDTITPVPPMKPAQSRPLSLL